MDVSMQTKLNLLKIAGEQGLLTDNQKLQIIGYPSLLGEEGSRRTISLNYISVNIADEYQMRRVKAFKDRVAEIEDDRDENEDE